MAQPVRDASRTPRRCKPDGFCSRTLAPSSRQNNWKNDQPNDKRLQFFSTKERLPIPMPNRIYIVVGTYYMVQVCAGPSSLQCSLDGKPTKLHLHSPSFCRQYLMKPFLLERTQTSFHESQVTRSSNMNIAFGRTKAYRAIFQTISVAKGNDENLCCESRLARQSMSNIDLFESRGGT